MKETITYNNLDLITDIQFIYLKDKIKELGFKRFLSVNIDKSSKIKSCKHCESTDINKWGRRDGMQRYKCKKCKKTFNALSGTPLARLRKKEKWIDYVTCMKKGLSVRATAKICDIHNKTSFKWRHRFLNNTVDIKADKLPGIVEMDSIAMFKSYKGCKKMPRTSRRRGRNKKEKDNSSEKFSVFFAENRASYIYDKIFDNICDCDLDFSIDSMLVSDNLLLSKENSIYQYFSKSKILQHSYVNNKKKNKIIHIGNVGNYQYNLLQWISRFNGVSTRYLDNYLSWYRFLDEFDMNIKPQSIILRACIGGKYKKLPLFTI